MFFFVGILSAFGNGYVLYMSSRRKKKLRPAEIMTINLAVCDLGISGNTATRLLLCGCKISVSLNYSLAQSSLFSHLLFSPFPKQICSLCRQPMKCLLKRSFSIYYFWSGMGPLSTSRSQPGPSSEAIFQLITRRERKKKKKNKTIFFSGVPFNHE